MNKKRTYKVKKSNNNLILFIIVLILLFIGFFAWTNSKIDNLNTQKITSDNQEPTVTLTPTLTPSGPKDLATIVSEWKPYVVLVTCWWGNVPMPKNQSYYQRGSSLMGYSDGEINLLTNAHVLENSGYGSPDKCLFSNSTDHYYEVKNPKIFFANNDVDAARIVISYQYYSNSEDKKYYDQNFTYFENLAKNNPLDTKQKWCNNAELGDNIAILGYPYTGGDRGTSLTVTEGIISGYDGNNYTTSAKIEHGNSGGVAISTKEDCYLGIPTSVYAGQLESLGRILKWQTIFN